ncbi:MAG: YIP1 family protein [Nanoarchaeota archaeon]
MRLKGLIHKIKQVLLEPERFFNSVKKEKGFKAQTVFLITVVFFVFLFLTYNYIQQINSFLHLLAQYYGLTAFNHIPLNIKTYAIFYFSLVILYLLLALLRYAVTHFFVKLFNSNATYQETYKAMVYTRSPEFFSAPILLILTILFPFALAKPILWSIWGVFFLAFLALSIYQIILRTKGLAKLQKISYLKSFLSIYIFGQIMQLIIILTIEVLLVGLIGFVLYFIF